MINEQPFYSITNRRYFVLLKINYGYSQQKEISLVKSKSTIYIIVGIVILAAFLVPRLLKETATQTANTDKKQGPPPGLTGFVVKQKPMSQEIRAFGSILANQEVELHPEVSGRVTAISFTEGRHVTKGDLLLKINDTELQSQRKKLLSQLDLSEKTANRQKQLLAANGISQQEYDITLNQLTGIKSDIELINEQIRKTEVRSPFSGFIGLRSVDEGAYITPATVISRIQDIDEVKIDFSIPEKYIHQIKTGDEIDFSVQGTKETFKARISAIEPRIDEKTRSVMIRAKSPNKSGVIFPGAFADVHLKLKEITNAIEIPSSAIIAEARGQKVFVCKAGKAEARKIKIGIRNELLVEVTEGLLPGDTVILTGIMMLKPDMPVKITQVKQD